MEKQEVMKDDNVLIFKPLAVTIFNVKQFQEALLPLLDGSTSININLCQTEELDISGLQLIKSLQHSAEIIGIDIKIGDISEQVSSKFKLLGVAL